MAIHSQRMQRLGKQNEFKVVDDIRRAQEAGVDVIRLNLGEPDFDSAPNVNACAIENINAGNSHYCDPQGVLPLRESVARVVAKSHGVSVDPDQVVITAGGKPPIPFTLLSYIDPGEEVVYPAPGFPAYETWVRYVGATPKPLHLAEEKEFRFDAADLEPLVNRNTKLLIINSPSNPTGGVLTGEDLDQVAELMKRKAHPDFRILTDEVYEKIVFDGRTHQSILSRPGMAEHTILMNCHSKTYAMTGWRLGYAVLPTVEEAQAFRLWTINLYSCTQPFIQMAGRQALDDPQNEVLVGQMRQQFQERRDAIIPEINAIPGMHCTTPAGAFYAFPNVGEVCRKLGIIDFCAQTPKAPQPATIFQLFALYKHGVATLDRAAFGVLGSEGQHFIRLSLASSLQTLRAGVARIAEASNDLNGCHRFLADLNQYVAPQA